MNAIEIDRSDALQNSDYASLIDGCEHIVRTELDLNTDLIRWDLERDVRGRDILALHFHDTLGGEAHGRFAPAELENEHHFRSRLRDLKGAAVLIGQWRGELKELCDRVGRLASTQIPPPYIESTTAQINEERSGEYEAPSLIIVRDGHTVTLEPIAKWVVGAQGRVDLVGDSGSEVLVLVAPSHWSWVSNRVDARLQVLTDELILELLDAVT